MVFNSIRFLLFLPVMVLLYYLVPRPARNVWLLIASYFFYLCWNPTHILVLLYVTAVAYLGGHAVGSAGGRGARRLLLL